MGWFSDAVSWTGRALNKTAGAVVGTVIGETASEAIGWEAASDAAKVRNAVISEGVDVVTTGAAVVVGTVAGETVTEAIGWDEANTVAKARNEALGAAWEWTSETAAPAVVNASEWVVVNAVPAHINPVGWAARGVEALGFENDLADKHRRSIEGINNFGTYVYNNPVRAGQLAVQGFSNGVTSTVGFVGDAGRMIVSGAYDIGRNVVSGTADLAVAGWKHGVNGVYSLGAADGAGPVYENIGDTFAITKSWNNANGNGGFFSTTKSWNEYSGGAFGYSTWMNDNTQWAADRIEPEIEAYVDVREFIEDANGDMIENPAYNVPVDVEPGKEDELPDHIRLKLIVNPDANYERVLLYGGQAVFEIPAFIGVTALTAGTGTAAYTASITGRGIQTAATLKRVDMVADGIRLAQRGAKLTDKAADASKITRAVGMADDFANGTRRFTMGSRLARRIKLKLGMNVDDAGRALKQSDLMEYLGKHADKVRDAMAKVDDLLKTATTAERQFLDKYKTLRQALKVDPSDAKAADELADLVKGASRGEKKLLNEFRKVENAESALQRATQDVNNIARSAGNTLEEISDDVALTASRTTEQMTTGARAMEGFRIGAMRGARFTDPFRSPVIDGIGVGGAFTVGVWADQKNAKAEIEGGVAISESTTEGVIGETTERARELGEDTSWFKPNNGTDSTDTPTDGSVPQNNLRETFPTVPNPSGNDYDLPGDSLPRDEQSGIFNNRSNGLVTPLDTPVFNIEVTEEAADRLRQVIQQR